MHINEKTKTYACTIIFIYINTDINAKMSSNMIKCTNMNMYTKMERLRDIIINTSEEIRMATKSFPDAAVLTEMTTMGSLSMKCDHYPTKHSHATAFERPVPHKTPSFVDDMNLPMTISPRAFKNLHVRQNPVTSALISDCVSILEFMDRFESRPEDVGTIVLGSYPSVTHAATVAYVFECVSAHVGWNGVVSMTIVTDEMTNIAMNAYVGPRLNVNLVHATNQDIYLNQMINSHNYGYMTVITHDYKSSRMLMSLDKATNVDINVVMNLETLKDEMWAKERCKELNLLMETCPCSNPVKNTVRIVPITTYGYIGETSIKYRNMSTPIFGFMKWYTVMIRRMKMDKMCYDCDIAFKLAYSVLFLMSGREMDMSEMTDKQWVDYFTTTVDTEGLLE